MERSVSARNGRSGPYDKGRRDSGIRRSGLVSLLALTAVGLAACSSDGMTPPTDAAMVPAGPAIAITSEQLIGKWGLGSFRNEADLARTTAEARRFCNNPYVITPGPQGGVMMYLADQTQPSELFIKSGGGRTYIGPPGPAGVIKDRQVTSFQDGVLVAAWVDPTVTARYGTMVFVKCPDSSAPATAAATPAVTLPAAQ